MITSRLVTNTKIVIFIVVAKGDFKIKYLEFKQVIREELLYMIGKLNDRLGSDLIM